MEMIATLLAGILTIPIFLPFVVFIIMLILLRRKSIRSKEALMVAANVTTFFLIIAVIMIYQIVKQDTAVSAIWWVLLFFIVVGGLISLLQHKIRGKINPTKMIAAVWRLAFVFFSLIYIILFFSGIQHFLSHT